MDCTACNNLLLDLLYDELDDVRAAAARRHMESCEACKTAYEGLARGRSLAGRLMLEEAPAPSDALLAAIRASVERAAVPLAAPVLLATHAEITDAPKDPHPQHMPRWLRRAGTFAMRREVAMAAVSLLIVGVSLRFVQVQSHGAADDQDLSPSPEVIPAQEVAGQPAAAAPPVSAAAHLRSLITGAPFRQQSVASADRRGVALAHQPPSPSSANGDLDWAQHDRPRAAGSAGAGPAAAAPPPTLDDGVLAATQTLQQARPAEEVPAHAHRDAANVSNVNRDLVAGLPPPPAGSPFVTAQQAATNGVAVDLPPTWRSELRRASTLRGQHPDQAITAYNHALDMAPDEVARRTVASEFCPFIRSPANASHYNETPRICDPASAGSADTNVAGNVYQVNSVPQTVNAMPHHAASRPMPSRHPAAADYNFSNQSGF